MRSGILTSVPRSYELHCSSFTPSFHLKTPNALAVAGGLGVIHYVLYHEILFYFFAL